MKVTIKTKSNFRNLNGKLLDVKEAVGNRISCFVETLEHGVQTIDFNIKEVTSIFYTK